MLQCLRLFCSVSSASTQESWDLPLCFLSSTSYKVRSLAAVLSSNSLSDTIGLTSLRSDCSSTREEDFRERNVSNQPVRVSHREIPADAAALGQCISAVSARHSNSVCNLQTLSAGQSAKKGVGSRRNKQNKSLQLAKKRGF